MIFITSKLYDLERNLQLLRANNVRSDKIISIQNGLVERNIYEPYIGDIDFTTISVFEGYRLAENQLLNSTSEM